MEMGTALLVGTIVSAVGTVAQAGMTFMSSQGQAAYAREMAARNLATANYAAKAAEAKASLEASLLRERGEKMFGKQLVSYGALGVTPEGSPAEFMGQTAMEYERDALNTLYHGRYQAWQAKTAGQTQAIEGEAAAVQAEERGWGSLFAAPFTIGSTILTGYGRYQMATKYPWLFGTGRGGGGSTFNWNTFDYE